MASSFASPSSFASDASFSEKYDVFVSFRGEDTRENFTSHLHAALKHKSIKTFIDNRIQKGEEVWPTLAKAIENSRASIVVFSKNYASSKWCLEELVKILECRKDQGQIVIPVFFEIDPSHVRKQSGSYEEAIAKHVRDYKDNESNLNKVSRWKAALTEAANIAGWSCTLRHNQSELIQNIANDIFRKLDQRYPRELKGLVGIYENQNCIESLLKKVLVVGIWGMGGIGKTTLAKAVFVKLSSQYQSCCFLENVREELQKRGLNHLSDRLRSQLLSQESMGSSIDMTWFGYKKVLIVFDDVSWEVLDFVDRVLDQLNLGQTGSRVIITARDKVLLTGRVNEIHEVKALSFEDSVKLFSLNAFKESSPKMGYEELSKSAVDYAKGVPLAIKVLGSLFHSRSIKSWKCELEKLHKYPNVQIQHVLRLSYDELENLHQEIFLDIAFFFKGEDKDVTTKILNACGFYATSGIDTLLCKALVTITFDNRIQMHDLIQAMGLEVVREKSIKDPGRRTRLRDIEEVYDVLKNNKGTDVVEGIMLNMSQITRDLHLSTDTFKKMPNLRFLTFYLDRWTNRSCDVYLPTGLESFPDKLRYLQWDEYPLGSLPSTFCLEKLVELRMPRSQVTKLWDGVQDLVNLRRIELRVCKQLIELPDFSKASKLKWVDLFFCESLHQLHPSILSLHSLEILDLEGCVKLRSLKSNNHLSSLKDLNLFGCQNLMEFSVSSEELKDLDLSATRIEKLNSSIGRFKKLEWLILSKCQSLSKLTENIKFLSRLESLDLEKSNIKSLPESIKHLSRLRRLTLRDCQRLCSLPELPPSIMELDATNCTSLKIVFTLKTSRLLRRNKKWISFRNCKNLDEDSIKGIIEDAHLSVRRAAYGNELLRQTTDKSTFGHSFSGGVSLGYKPKRFHINYNDYAIFLPGDRVPEWFRYRARQAYIVVELPPPAHLLGFVLCVVLSQSPDLDPTNTEDCYYGYHATRCQCYSEEGKKIGTRRTRLDKAIQEMTSHHVYLRYDPDFDESILVELGKSKTNYQCNTTSYPRVKVSFHFNAFVSNMERNILECGVCPIYASEYSAHIGEMVSESKLVYDSETELESDSKINLESDSGFKDKTKRPREIEKLEAREIGDGVGSSSEKESLPQSRKLKECTYLPTSYN